MVAYAHGFVVSRTLVVPSGGGRAATVLNWNVLVLGTGGAGLTAALAAHDFGAGEVLVLEKYGMVIGKVTGNTKRGLREASIDGKKVKFEFTVLTSNRPDRVDICTLLKQNLGEIGISVNVRPVEFTQMQEKMQNHDFHAAFGGWGTGTGTQYGDPRQA